MLEQSLILIIEEVGQILVGGSCPGAFFTAVAGNEPRTVGETAYGKQAVIGTALASRDRAFRLESRQLFAGKQGGTSRIGALSGNESRTKSPHEARNIKA